MLIFANELRQGRRALVAWSISVAAYAAFFISFFGKMDMADMIRSIPEGMRTAFDMDVLDLGTVLGFWAMEGHIMTLLGGGIFATLIAASMLAKEESDRTISFLYSKPLTRAQIVTGKLMAIFANVAIFNFIVHAGLQLGIVYLAKAEYGAGTLWWLALASLLAHTSLASLGLAASSAMSKTKNALPLALALPMASFAIEIIAKASERSEWMRYLSPFYYANATDIVHNGSMARENILILAAVSAVGIALTYLTYSRKDLTA